MDFLSSCDVISTSLDINCKISGLYLLFDNHIDWRTSIKRATEIATEKIYIQTSILDISDHLPELLKPFEYSTTVTDNKLHIYANRINLAFYTCFFGSEQNVAFVIPEISNYSYPCYFYTNNRSLYEKLQGTEWRSILVDEPLLDDAVGSSMQSKIYKACPHIFEQLKPYKYTCWIDTKLPPVDVSTVQSLIQKYLHNTPHAMLLRKHWYVQGSVWNEYNLSIELHERYRLQQEKLKKYMDDSLADGISDKTETHMATGFIIRRSDHPTMNAINDMWYTEIQKCGTMCQISFFFVKKRYDNEILAITEYPYTVPHRGHMIY